MALSAPQMGTLQVRWDPKNLEIKTKSVEKTLEPLVTQVKFTDYSKQC
jgi:catenin alpha